jgi:DNA-binding MarR family transcriptional regulator
VRNAVRVLVRLRRVLERADIGLTLPQYQLLQMVRSGGERSAKLADKLAVRKPTLTAAVDGLVAAGLLERATESGDRRVVRIRITEAGLDAVARAEDQLAQVMGPLFADSGDPGALFDALDSLEAALNRHHEAWHAARFAAAPPDDPIGVKR